MSARLSRPVNIRRLAAPEDVAVVAEDAERVEIAAALDLLSLERLEAQVTLSPWQSRGVKVAGTVEADVVQACVVTLEPVPATVREAFEVRLHPGAEPAAVDVDPEAPDPPEPLESDTVDIGAIALEHFVLALPEYPRVPGADFTPPEETDAPEASPFAVLAQMKDRLG